MYRLQETPISARLAQQQKRNLSIHEYLSARLLKQVCLSRAFTKTQPCREEESTLANNISQISQANK